MISENCRRLRQERGYSLGQLAEMTGISKSYLCYIEKGDQQNPSIKVLTKIARALGCSVDELTGEATGEASLDKEWVDLIIQARKQGMSKEEFKLWLEFSLFRKVHDSGREK
ncbi:helix-turn-helix domain-containing protein [Peribacillus sp. SCS-26]|uniref:helix-turn-helix domain-containing protein n=1 Tax=Paraperibacillus marinus TaxID=3115295 RepID=UPI003906D542